MLSSSPRVWTLSLLIAYSGLLGSQPLVAGQEPTCLPPAMPVPMMGATLVGLGTPGSVTAAAIQAALDEGGPILLNAGSDPVTIELDAPLVVTRETALDGGGLVTLSGGNARRVIQVENPQNLTYTLTLQNIGIADGSTPSGSGAGVYKPSGGPWQAVSLVVIDSWFQDNTAIATAQDDGGGAIYATGMNEVILYRSRFENNRGSNGGAVYSLGSKTVTVVESDFIDNRATGTNGNPGNGGNGGAIGIDGGERTVTLCRARLTNNRANAFGAGLFTVMYDDLSLTAINASTFQGNTNPLDTFGFAGGAYLQGGPFSIHNSSFIANQARANGALFIGPGASGEMVNSTFVNNLARASLGGAMSIDSSAVVTIRNSTIAGNDAPCDVCFGAGISNSASNQITMSNTILYDNVGGNEFNPWNIRFPVTDGGGNMQFPRFRPNGQEEIAATATVIWDDPALLPHGVNGGPTRTMALGPGSPAIDAGTDVGAPSTDQRGASRDAMPDIGAYEVSDIFSDGFEAGDLSAWSASIP